MPLKPIKNTNDLFIKKRGDTVEIHALNEKGKKYVEQWRCADKNNTYFNIYKYAIKSQKEIINREGLTYND